MTDTSPPRPDFAPLRPGHTSHTSPPRPSPIGGGEEAHLETTSTSPLGIDWEERLRIAVEETLRKRELRRQERQEFKARRDAGLEIRHRTKLARNRQENAMTSTPPCCAGLSEPCPQHVQAARVQGHAGPRSRGGAAQRVVGESGRIKPARDANGDAA